MSAHWNICDLRRPSAVEKIKIVPSVSSGSWRIQKSTGSFQVGK